MPAGFLRVISSIDTADMFSIDLVATRTFKKFGTTELLLTIINQKL